MKGLELKVPPLLLVAIFAAGMWLVAGLWSTFSVGIRYGFVLAVLLVAAGVGIALSGVLSFSRAQTTVNPLTPESSAVLVETGVYRFSRNPMYLGFLLALSGWAVYLANGLAFLFLPCFVLYMNRFQILPEERALSARFNSAFSAYARRVRRWL